MGILAVEKPLVQAIIEEKVFRKITVQILKSRIYIRIKHKELN